MAEVQIMTAQVVLDGGTAVAQVERIRVGGGIQTVTVDGIAEQRQHPTFVRHHARLLSPDRMIPDQLLEVDTYDEAVQLCLAYAAKRVEHATQIDALAASLRA